MAYPEQLHRPVSRPGEPAWEVATLFPPQGEWSEAEYLALETNRAVEFSDGIIEVLPMPTLAHQRIVAFLYRLLFQFVNERGLGEVLFAALPVRLRPGKYREPDVVYLSTGRLEQTEGRYPRGADLVVEVVSGGPEDRERDLVTKRQEYAEAGIAEYWIVDPQLQRITVLTLAGDSYEVHGEFAAGQQATSKLLAGFSVDVEETFDAAE